MTVEVFWIHDDLAPSSFVNKGGIEIGNVELIVYSFFHFVHCCLSFGVQTILNGIIDLRGMNRIFKILSLQIVFVYNCISNNP